MRLPPLSAARCRITASISHKFFAAAGAVPPPYFKERRDDHARKKAERAPLGSWLIVWQLAAMALHAAYPHGALLLPSPVSSLARLISLAGTAVFWCAIGTSSMHILGGFLLSCALAVVLALFILLNPNTAMNIVWGFMGVSIILEAGLEIATIILLK